MPNLDAFLKYVEDDALALPMPNGQTYLVPSPSIQDGELLQKLMALGTKAALHDQLRQELEGHAEAAGRPLNAQERRRLDEAALSERELASLSLDDEEERTLQRRVLGDDLVEQMKADGVTWPQLQKAGQYALTYFTMGEEAADRAITRVVDAGKAPSSTGTAAATTTPRRASGSGTRSRKNAPRR